MNRAEAYSWFILDYIILLSGLRPIRGKVGRVCLMPRRLRICIKEGKLLRGAIVITFMSKSILLSTHIILVILSKLIELGGTLIY